MLRRSIESVLGQSTGDWTHVVVNDGGDPGPVDAVVAEHAQAYDGRVVVRHHPRSLGMEAASNAGIRAADSRFIAIHDDDDSWHPDFLERMLARLAGEPDPAVQGVACHSEIVREDIEGGRIVERERLPFNPELATISLPRLACGNLFPPISFLFSREAYERTGPFDESLPVLGDWDFNMRFARLFDIVVLPEVLARWHHRSSAASTDLDNSFLGRDRPHERIRARIVNRAVRGELSAPPSASGLFSSAEQLDHLRGLIDRAAAARDERSSVLLERSIAEQRELGRALLERADAREASLTTIVDQVARLEAQVAQLHAAAQRLHALSERAPLRWLKKLFRA